MKKTILFIALFASSLVGQVSAQIQSGLPVPLSLSQSVTTKHLKKGTIIPFRVSSEVYDEEGELVIPEGATAYGTVTNKKCRHGFGSPAEVTISVNKLTLPNGKTIELQADDLRAKGKSLKKRCNLYYALFCCWFVTIPVAGFTYGGHAYLDAGTSVQAYTK